MKNYSKIKKWLEEADCILIGAGAGLSDAAGIHYSGDKFQEDFKDFINKYGIKDLYTSSFYPFPSEEEKWAYWAKHIYFSYYERMHTKLYEDLFQLVKDRDYFVLTTNTDGQFLSNGFDSDKVFEIQGSYAKLQCSTPCHNKLYDNHDMVMEWLDHIDGDLKIPTSMVPKCPVCGENMNVNLRCDDTFVEDDHWEQLQENYEKFLNHFKNKKVLLLEFGVGYNTPGIIRFPFEEMTFHNENVRLVRFNNKHYDVPYELGDKAIGINDNILKVLESLL